MPGEKLFRSYFKETTLLSVLTRIALLEVIWCMSACFPAPKINAPSEPAASPERLTIKLSTEMELTVSGLPSPGEIYRSIPVDIPSRMIVKELIITPRAPISNSILGHRYVRWEIPKTSGTYLYKLQMEILLNSPFEKYHHSVLPFFAKIDPLGEEPYVKIEDERIQSYAATLEGLDMPQKVSGIVSYLRKNIKYKDADGKWVHEMNSHEALDAGYGHTGQICSVFAALSRSMKIPTIIMGGFTGDERRVYLNHWVEVETHKDRWEIIDIASIVAGYDEESRKQLYYIPVAFRTREDPQKSAFSLGSVYFSGGTGKSLAKTSVLGYKLERQVK